MSEESNPSGPELDSRVIRVFISSTFRDMQRERELLVKEVFPDLRRVCDERFVSFTEVDLRWGITEEQQAEGKVLPICLEEIQTCRPYFIGILGERYGWIPNVISPEILSRQPWVKEFIDQSASVTELEILQGVLLNPEMAAHAFFYFRDPAYIAKLSESERAEMLESDIPGEIAELGPAEASRRTQNRKDRLAALKEIIRESHLPLVDPYANPEALAVIVHQQFLDLIDTLYPKEQVPDPLDQEAIGHRTYARRKVLACIDRPTHLAALDAFANSSADGHGIVVAGDSGAGKTALAAAWSSRYRRAHPDHFVLEHFFGATPESVSAPQFLRRLLGELKRLSNISDEIPFGLEEMAEALPLWLARSIGRAPRIVLVLDALNQIEGELFHRNLFWLPSFFPTHIRVIASTLPGPALESLRERGWIEHSLPLADVDERGWMVDAFLGEYRKQLDPPLRDRIVGASGAANPLFLRTMLEELRQFGDFDRLSERVRDYLQATNPAELFRRVIQRFKADFHAGRDLVDRSLCFLWAAHQGLSECEWLDLLADAQGPMDRQTWRPLFLALAPHLVSRSGLWALGHDYLKQAIEAEQLPTDMAKKYAHLALADYFEQHPSQRKMNTRKAAEWPQQLMAAEAWERLEVCLTDIPLFLALYNDETKWELASYWHPLRKRGRDIGKCYSEAYRRWIEIPANTEDHHVSAQLGEFLILNRQDEAAGPFVRRTLEVRTKLMGDDHPETLCGIHALAWLLGCQGNYSEAEVVVRKAVEGRERILGEVHPQTLDSLSLLANLRSKKGDLITAESLTRRVLDGRERALGRYHPETLRSISELSRFLEGKGDNFAAERLRREVLDHCTRAFGEFHPDSLSAMNNLALLLSGQGHHAEAEALLRHALQYAEQTLGDDNTITITILNSLGMCLAHQTDYRGAERLYRRGLEARERGLGEDHPETQIAVSNLAYALLKQGDLKSSERLYRRALGTRERILGKDNPTTLLTAYNLAGVLGDENEQAEAESLYNYALEGLVRAGHPAAETVRGAYLRFWRARPRKRDDPGPLISAIAFAGQMAGTGNYASARTLYEDALERSTRVFGADSSYTLTVINNLAFVLESQGDHAAALPMYERAVESSERVLGAEHEDTLASLSNLAFCLKSKGDCVAAEPLYRRALEGFLKISKPVGLPDSNLQTTLNNYSACLESLGRSPNQIRQTLDEMGHRFGFRLGGGEAASDNDGVGLHGLQAVIDQVKRNPSKCQEIGDRLKSEDPKLYREFIQWLLNS